MDSRRSIGVAAALVLALPATASAHVLSEDVAREQAEEVAGFVAGVLTTEYRLREYGVRSCDRRSEHKVVCGGYWKMAERKGRKRWTCQSSSCG